MVDNQDEDSQLKEYEKFIKWYEECSSGFEDWYESNKVDDPKYKEQKRVSDIPSGFNISKNINNLF